MACRKYYRDSRGRFASKYVRDSKGRFAKREIKKTTTTTATDNGDNALNEVKDSLNDVTTSCDNNLNTSESCCGKECCDKESCCGKGCCGKESCCNNEDSPCEEETPEDIKKIENFLEKIWVTVVNKYFQYDKAGNLIKANDFDLNKYQADLSSFIESELNISSDSMLNEICKYTNEHAEELASVFVSVAPYGLYKNLIDEEPDRITSLIKNDCSQVGNWILNCVMPTTLSEKTLLKFVFESKVIVDNELLGFAVVDHKGRLHHAFSVSNNS